MYIPWPKNRFLRHIEGRGHGLRVKIGLGPLDRLEPSVLVDALPNVLLAPLHALAGTRKSADLDLLRRHSESWSALALRESTGPWLVTWNPWHADTRTRVSLMEEIAHIILEHKPTSFVTHPTTGLPVRTYSPSKEKEAYAVAGAAVIPYVGLVQLLRRGASVSQIAEHFGVSSQLATMRLNTTGARFAAAAGGPGVARTPGHRALPIKAAPGSR